MTRSELEATLAVNIERMNDFARGLRKQGGLPEDQFHDTAIIEYGGCTLVLGGDFEPACDQWAGGFDVCSVRIEDSRTDIIGLFSADALKTMGDRAYWSIRNDTFAMLDATR